MPQLNDLTLEDALSCLEDASERAWALLGRGQLADGSCFIADVTDAPRICVRGFYDGPTGDVFECTGEDAEARLGGKAPAIEPAIHVIGALDGASGQITVRQEQGNYLRVSNWSRVDSGLPLLKGAEFRTLPQCGCGGSLGAPKLFESAVEMCAYHFCAFYL